MGSGSWSLSGLSPFLDAPCHGMRHQVFLSVPKLAPVSLPRSPHVKWRARSPPASKNTHLLISDCSKIVKHWRQSMRSHVFSNDSPAIVRNPQKTLLILGCIMYTLDLGITPLAECHVEQAWHCIDSLPKPSGQGLLPAHLITSKSVERWQKCHEMSWDQSFGHSWFKKKKVGSHAVPFLDGLKWL